MTPEPRRAGAFEGLAPFPSSPRAKLAPTGPLTRLLFRGGQEAAAAMSAAFGPVLSETAMRANEDGGRAALWLGPDEWLLIARDGEFDAIMAVLTSTDLGPHSLVDVSHRNTGLILSGTKVAEVLNAGCPLDLDLGVFPVGTCTRTLLTKAEIVLWRQAADRFHIECWRSFGPYVHQFLSEAAREFA